MPKHPTRAVPKVSDEQRGELQGWLRRSKTGQSLALRARIVLPCADGKSDMAVAAALGTTRATGGKWRRRFPSDGCDGWLDEPPPGAPRKVSDGDVERVVTRTWESLPRGATQWSREGAAREPRVDGDGLRPEPLAGGPHLARLRPKAAPPRNVQAVEGPVVR